MVAFKFSDYAILSLCEPKSSTFFSFQVSKMAATAATSASLFNSSKQIASTSGGVASTSHGIVCNLLLLCLLVGTHAFLICFHFVK